MLGNVAARLESRIASDVRAACLIALIAAVLCGAVALRMPFKWSYPPYMFLAQSYIESSRIESDFYPIGYVLFIAAMRRAGDLEGLVLGQCVLYVSAVVLAYALSRVLHASKGTAFFGALLVALHPLLPVIPHRVEDNNLVVPLILSFAIVLAVVRSRPPTLRMATLCGILLGCGVLVRPNLFSLLPVFAFSFLWGAGDETRGGVRRVFALCLVVAVAFGVSASVSLHAKGNLKLIPYSGSYNLAAGANPHALESLVHRYNAERSLTITLEERDIRLFDRNDAHASQVYWKLAGEFIKENPVEYLVLGGFKLVNFFRPDYRHVGSQNARFPAFFIVLVETLRAAPFAVWLLVRVISFRSRALTKDPLVPLLVLFFVLPYVASNSDPRFRIPLDVLFIVESVGIIGVHLGRKARAAGRRSAA